MRYFQLSLIALLSLILALAPLVGCMPTSGDEDWQNKYETLLLENTVLKVNLEEAQADITYLKSALEKSKDEYETLKADHSTLRANSEKLQAEYDSLQTTYNTLQANYNTMKLVSEQLNSVNSQLSTLKAERDSLNSQLLAIKSERDKLSAELATLKEQSTPTTSEKTYLGWTEGHWVKDKLESGKYIILDDSSLWEISSIDRYKTFIWLRLDSITILENPTGFYPYKLINHSSGDIVEARYLGK